MRSIGARILVVLVGLALVSGSVLAKPAAGPVPIPLRISAGDRFTVTVEKSRETTRNGQLTKTPAVVSVFDGEYINALANGYRLRWTLRSAHVKAGDTDAKLPDAVSSLVGVTFEVDTDGAGVPQRVNDLAGTVERIVALLKQTGRGDEQAISFFRQLFAHMDERAAALTLFREQVAIALFQNTSLALGETRQIPAVVPNPLGGPAINMQQSLTLVRVNGNSKTASFHFSSRLDPASLAVSMKAAMGKLMESIGDKARKAAAEKVLAGQLQANKVVSADATVSTIDGWLRDLTMSEEVDFTSGGETGSRIDTTRIVIEHVR